MRGLGSTWRCTVVVVYCNRSLYLRSISPAAAPSLWGSTDSRRPRARTPHRGKECEGRTGDYSTPFPIIVMTFTERHARGISAKSDNAVHIQLVIQAIGPPVERSSRVGQSLFHSIWNSIGSSVNILVVRFVGLDQRMIRTD